MSSEMKKDSYPAESILQTIADEWQDKYQYRIIAAKVDNRIKGLQMPIGTYKKLDFIDMSSTEGQRIYRRSVLFIFILAVRMLYPHAIAKVKFSANKGLYCEIALLDGLNKNKADLIAAKMSEIISQAYPVQKKNMSCEKAVALFKDSGQKATALLLQESKKAFVSLYYCAGFCDYIYGELVHNTSVLGAFALDFYPPGILLRTPLNPEPEKVPPFLEQPKLVNIMDESKQWAKILRCDYVYELNDYIKNGYADDIVRVSEALQEKKIAYIADYIAQRKNTLRLITIAGPSSSGKTSFAQRLMVQLRVNGVNPVSISLDDYFCARELTPKNEKGEFDFENIHALDIDLFNEHLTRFMSGEEVVIPRFDFVVGHRTWRGCRPIHLDQGQPIIIEGIHGLNEQLTSAIPRANKYKIYVSALTQINVDVHNRIPTTDARLIRRLVRDYRTRGSSALHTLKIWPVVREGEEKNIFPFQEEADIMFNSAMIYEIAVLKKYVKPLLERISPELPEYSKACQILDLCQYFNSIDNDEAIPNNSILREFIGKSCFFKE